MNVGRGKEGHRERIIHLNKTETQTGISAAVIIRDIKTVISEQTALVSEGRLLAAEMDDLPAKQQVGVIINMLSMELESASARLEELIARFNSA